MTTKPQSTVETLLPCPFCGAKPRLITIPGFEPRCYVMCSLGCGACGPEFNGRDAADRATTSWNTRPSPASAAPVVDSNSLHWQSKTGAEETMCGRLAKDVRCTVLQDFATCEMCKAVAFGYQMGRADERAVVTAAPQQSEHVEATATEQPDPSTCPGCAAGRCMVHEPIIRADATSIARAAAEEIDDYYDGLVGFNIAIKAPETVATIIKRHYEGAR